MNQRVVPACACAWAARIRDGFVLLGILLLWALQAQAAIVLEGNASGSNTALPTDGSPGALTILRPAAAKPGMALVVSIAARPSQMTWTSPAGWTQLSIAAEQTNGGSSTAPGGMTMRTYYRIVGLGEPNSYTWTFANPQNEGGSAVGGMLVFSGLDTSSNPLDATPTSRLMDSTSTTTFRTNPVTTVTNNAVVVSMLSYLSAGSFSQPTCNPVVTPAPTITEVLDISAPPTSNAVGTTLQMSYFTQATAGVSCAPQATVNGNADSGIGHLMALKPSARDLSLSLSRGGPLTPGGAASYTMTITNAGSLAEPGPLTIVNTLPAGLTYVSASGAGWACSASGQTVNCQKTGSLAAGISATPLVVNVNVAAGTSGVITYTATASGTGGDGNTTNNTAIDTYVIPTVPYAEYRLDEASWGTILDSTGNGHNATVLGTAAPVSNPSTPPGSALSGSPGTCGIGSIPSGTGTNGINANVDVNSLGNAGSITFWYASKESWIGNNRILFDASNDLGGGNSDKHFFLVKTSNGQLRFALEDSADTDSTATSPSYNFAANTWHHVAVTWDLAADSLNIYLDGDTAPVATSTTDVNGTLGDMATLYFGAQRMANVQGTPTGYTNNTANAYLDEIRLYTKALDPMEIDDIASQRHSCGGVSIATPGAITEGNSGSSTLNFTVSLDSTRSSAVSVNFATSDGTATGSTSCGTGVDYVTTTGTLSIPAGTLTATIPVTVCGDTAYEANETFTVTLSNPSGVILDSPNTATGTINNDDTPPTVSVAVAQTTEGDSGTKSLSIPVTLSAASGMDTSVDYTFTNGTATGGASCSGTTDFINTAGTLIIPAGSTAGTIGVPICGDTTYESDETFTVTLSNPGNAGLGSPASVTGTIVNDDVDPAGCYLDTFTGADGSAPSSNWTTTTSSGSYGVPKIYGNRLRMTDASLNVSTAAHLQRLFPGAGNKIVVEFDQFAYSGTGADGIALTFSDASVTPRAGAFGGSLGYAQKCQNGVSGCVSDCSVSGGCPGFTGGWLGIGFDEFGNYSNATEGRIGGPGSQPDRVAIRGSGSGQTGYVYHTSSALLSPGIDQAGATPGPNYRYRVTIDHTDGVHAYVSIERSTNGGTSYATIVSPYDAKAQAGQAAVPANWLLSYTGSTGSSVNIHEIDNLKVCAVKPIVPIGPNHYVISHSGTGLTCEAEPVTFTAHDAGHSRANAGGRTISISTSTNKGAWFTAADNCTGTCYDTNGATVGCAGVFTGTTGNNGQASYAFASGETGIRLCLKHNEAATVNINVSDGSATESSGAASGEGTSTDPSLTFSNTGFRFYAGGTVDAIEPLVAGLRSDTVVAGLQPAPKTITIQALKATTTTPARCVALLGNGTRTVQFAYRCTDPNACHASSGGLEVNGTAVAGSSTVPTPASNVSVDFDSSGVGTINLKYWDVGQIQLYAQASVPDGLTGTSTTAIVTGASNAFVVKPYGFDVRACTGATPCTAANDAAADVSAAVFARAGNVFNATVKAIAYGSTVAAPKVTPSFGLGTANDTESVNLATTLIAPAPAPDPANGTPGALGGTVLPKRNVFTDGVANITDLSWSEVGVMTLTATNSQFLGTATAATGSSGNIGRFTPHHFVLSAGAITPADAAGGYSYMGQTFGLGFTLTAENAAAGTTTNYDAAKGFARLAPATANWLPAGLGTNSSFGLGARNNTDNLSNRLALVGNPAGAWASGAADITVQLSFSRPATAAPDATWGPYEALDIGVAPQDADGITLLPAALNLDVDNNAANERVRMAATTRIRYGRVRLDNAVGSERLPLRVPVTAQYWNGAQGWITNAQDGTTALAAGNVALTNVVGIAPAIAIGVSGASVAAGVGTINFPAPGMAGSADATLTVPDFLRFRWQGAGADTNPTAHVSFGLYKGSNRFIYLREGY